MPLLTSKAFNTLQCVYGLMYTSYNETCYSFIILSVSKVFTKIVTWQFCRFMSMGKAFYAWNKIRKDENDTVMMIVGNGIGFSVFSLNSFGYRVFGNWLSFFLLIYYIPETFFLFFCKNELARLFCIEG